MKLILHIDTATDLCSVALAADGSTVASLRAEQSLSHASELLPLVDRLFTAQGISVNQLAAVSVSAGPGSYTGLRIGVSTAKGICYACDIPLIAVNSLILAAHAVKQVKTLGDNDLIIPMIDARRMEVYGAVFSPGLEQIVDAAPWIIDQESFSEWGDRILWLAGSGALKLKTLFSERPHIHFIDEEVHHAGFASELVFQWFKEGKFADTAYFEPEYGKAYLAALPVVKGLK